MHQTGRIKKSALIYLVDDQPMLLDLVEASLLEGGYQLKKFQDPHAALLSVRKAKSKPDLLVTDYAMGTMNGIDLIEKCKALAPRLKTILLSGTIGAEILFDSPVKVDRFLGKPFQPRGLADTVKTVLDS